MEMNTLNDDFDGMLLSEQAQKMLRETAKWTRFLSIMGFIGLGFMVIAGLMLPAMMARMPDASGMGGMPMAGIFAGGFLTVLYLGMALLYFFPIYNMYKFSNAMQSGLDNGDENMVTQAFGNLKFVFKFMGIVTLVILAIYAIILLLAGVIAVLN